jgi:predicted acetyltransferase
MGMRVRHADEVALVVRQASEEAKPTVRRLLELSAYDFSAIDGRDIGPDGEYGYPYLDHYWGAANDRAAFLFHVDAQLAGFALVRLGTPHQVAEFLVLPKYRRRGLGTAAARQVLSVWYGEWLTRELPGNDGAVAFWRRAIPVPFTETSDATETTQRFVITK